MLSIVPEQHSFKKPLQLLPEPQSTNLRGLRISSHELGTEGFFLHCKSLGYTAGSREKWNVRHGTGYRVPPYPAEPFFGIPVPKNGYGAVPKNGSLSK